MDKIPSFINLLKSRSLLKINSKSNELLSIIENEELFISSQCADNLLDRIFEQKYSQNPQEYKNKEINSSVIYTNNKFEKYFDKNFYDNNTDYSANTLKTMFGTTSCHDYEKSRVIYDIMKCCLNREDSFFVICTSNQLSCAKLFKEIFSFWKLDNLRMTPCILSENQYDLNFFGLINETDVKRIIKSSLFGYLKYGLFIVTTYPDAYMIKNACIQFDRSENSRFDYFRSSKYYRN